MEPNVVASEPPSTLPFCPNFVQFFSSHHSLHHHASLKAYLDELEAKAQARQDASARLFDALFAKLITGASTQQSAPSAVVASDGGLTHNTPVPTVVPDVFSAPSSTSNAQEVLELIPDASREGARHLFDRWLEPSPRGCLDSTTGASYGHGSRWRPHR